MDLVTQYRALAQYNSWMNRKIYDACELLSDEQRRRDLHAFFGTIHATLNHLLLTDRVQLSRFIGIERTRSLDQNGRPIEIRSLDQQLYERFEDLRRERAQTDALIEAWTGEISPDFLAREMEYDAMSSPGRFRCPVWIMVTHFFNHQTHHRGQVTTMLTQLGRDPGVTDLMAMFRTAV